MSRLKRLRFFTRVNWNHATSFGAPPDLPSLSFLPSQRLTALLCYWAINCSLPAFSLHRTWPPTLTLDVHKGGLELRRASACTLKGRGKIAQIVYNS
jgi:hypothetical protein